jgi:hypothetical protein
MNERIEELKAMLIEAESIVDTVYHYAMDRGTEADELRFDMNAAGNAINNGYDLLNKLRDE